MLRLVFQDCAFYSAYEIVPDEQLSDVFIEAIEHYCPQLSILALSATKKITSGAICKLLKSSIISTLDLHCTKGDQLEEDGPIEEVPDFGLVDDDFISPILYNLNNVKVLNMFGQCNISPSILTDFIKSEASRKLESLCLNHVPLELEFLGVFLTGDVYIQRLSIVECGIRQEDIKAWLEDPRLALQKIYCSTKIAHPRVCESDGWFMDESLDIHSLWANSITRH